MRLLFTSLLALSFVGTLSSDLQAVIVEAQSNPVANGAITVAPGNNDRSDWSSIPSFQSDPIGDASAIDYAGVQIAHDDTNVYFHLTFGTQSSPQFLGFMHNMFLDTDLDRSTGFYGAGGFLALGADFLIQGSSYFGFAGGTQEAFSWAFLGTGDYDDFPTTDIEIKIARTAIGNPDVFDIVLNTATSPTNDYYPDVASGGIAGGSFRYSLVSVPEPDPVLFMLLVGFCVIAQKTRLIS